MRRLAYLGFLAASALAAWSLLIARDGSRAMESMLRSQERIVPLFQLHAQSERAVAVGAVALLLNEPALLNEGLGILRSATAQIREREGAPSRHGPALEDIRGRMDSLAASLAKGERPSMAKVAALARKLEETGAALSADESAEWATLAGASAELLESQARSARALRLAFLALSIGLGGLLWAVARRDRDEANAGRRDRLAAILSSSLEEGVLLCGRGGEVLACNDAAGALLGIPASALRSRRLGSVLPSLVREDGSRVPADEAPPLARLARGEPNPGSVIGLVRPNFRVRWLSFHSRPLEDPRGPGPSVVRLVDVTERVESRAIIDRQKAELASKERLSAIGEMAGGIAHEINNPLAIIHADAEELLDLAAEGHSVEAASTRAVAGRIRGTASRIAEIVRGIKAVAQASPQAPPVETPLSRIVADSLELCRERFHGSDAELRVSPVPAGLTLPCRPTQISQVLVNLLTNARDAVEGRERPWIAVECSDRGEHVEIAVTDSGSGIAPDLEKRIFTPLFTTKGAARGTGLGLSISKGIVEDHGGRIHVDRECPNTRFVVTLPKARARSKAA